MQTLLIEAGLRATLIVAAVAVVLCGLRIRTASARHAVWSSVVLTMLALPALIEWGPKLALPFLSSAPAHRMVDSPVLHSSAVLAIPLRVPSPEPTPSTSNSAIVLLGVYLSGACVLLARLAIGTIRTSRLTSASCAVPLTVGFFRPRIILPQSSGAWPRAQLEVTLVHEREHARRRDPLVQWIALLNRALFWFHPLSWWLERKLAELAEEACDAAVLAQGHDPHDYSECLLKVSRMVELAGRRIDGMAMSGGMAMAGTFLPQRIKRILSGAQVPAVSRARMVYAAAACAGAVTLLTVGTLVRAQSKATASAFEVVSVKAFNPKTGGAGPFGLNHRRFNDVDSLFGLILKAYGIKGCGNGNMQGVECLLLTGGPAWIHDSVFEIQARTSESSATPAQVNLMMQTLLRERFNLKLHHETKQLPVYTLTAGKSGPKAKLKKATDAEQPSLSFPRTDDAVHLTVRNHSIEELAAGLSNMMGRPVLDRTGIVGKFDFTVDYEADPDARGYSALASPSLLAAFQDQLGLKLESTKGPVDVLVIDQVQKPSEN